MGSPRAGSNPARCGPEGLRFFLFFPFPAGRTFPAHGFSPPAAAPRAMGWDKGTERGRSRAAITSCCRGSRCADSAASAASGTLPGGTQHSLPGQARALQGREARSDGSSWSLPLVPLLGTAEHSLAPGSWHPLWIFVHSKEVPSQSSLCDAE